MTPTRLERIGEALYGPRWQSELARELGVADRTVRRWVSGETPEPEDLHERLKTLVRAKVKILRGLQ